MSWQGMKNLEKVYYNKVNDRIREIESRFIWSGMTAVTDVAAAEWKPHITVAEAKRLRYRPVKAPFVWGEPRGTCWFRLRVRVPSSFRGETVVLKFVTGGENLVFRDGQPVQALDGGRDRYTLADRARGGKTIELYVEGGATGGFGDFQRRTMQQPEISVLNREVWAAFWDLSCLADMIATDEEKQWLLGGVMRAMDPEDTRRARILYALSEAVDLFDYGSPARDALRKQALAARRALKPVYACRANASAQTIAAFGHAHIDVAWLWPLAETQRKCGRTFSNVLELMRRYPEFIFVQSQPHLYEFTKNKYPGLYRRIKERIRAGKWVPTGGMWVEADCNVTSGESLVRQILFGTRFFKREFGFEVKDVWIPDVFGYSAAMPQIIRRSGLSYFLTQKLSWSQFSKFPHHSFWWQGIDGTKVLTHFPPVDTYGARLVPKELLTAERWNRQKDRCSIQAVPFGFGDGGGGPAPAMLERMRRYRDLEGMPKVVPMTVKDFFGRLEKESGVLPTWVGELYLEMHRGTYTTQAQNKKNNRLSEISLRNAEILASLAMAQGAHYDQERLNKAWKLVLLNQFHDVLPGSSIDEVYEESGRQYEAILEAAAEVRSRAIAALCRKIDTSGKGLPVVVMNTLGWCREGTVEFAHRSLKKGQAYTAHSTDDFETPVQLCRDGKARFLANAPSIGHRVFHVRPGRKLPNACRASPRMMENSRLRVEFDGDARLVRVCDKLNARDLLAPGSIGNRLTVFEDKTVSCGPAWDFEIFYNDKPLEHDGRLVSARVVENGPVRAVLRIERRISRSAVRHDVILTGNSARLDFETTIDWHKDEKDVILKTAFPLNVHAEKARYEIQFGSVDRPTHWNRPSDFGMFEVCAQKWADMSDGNYGVALLNDCKYGHDARGNVLRLTLLRAPKSPGKTVDVGRIHRITYSLFPHAGSFANGVVHAGYELNVPLIAGVQPPRAGEEKPVLSRLAASSKHVVIDTVKKAEDGNSIIVRMYEADGTQDNCEMTTSLPVKRAFETNLMEEVERPVACRNGKMRLRFKPFQIVTLKLIL